MHTIMIPREFTFLAIGVGLMVGVVMTAANVYLGLYAGMTITASIPAAVIAMAVFRGILQRQSILESNLVQTIASTGESIAGGVIFTLPALVLVGVWQDFRFWPTSLIAIAGGLLGVAFMVPLRRALIVEEKELTYPEGVACAAVLKTGSSESVSGVWMIAKGLLVGGIVKFCSGALGALSDAVEYASRVKNSVFYFGADISPALMAVGYIVRLPIAMLVFLGGAIGWLLAIPMLGIFGIPEALEGETASEAAWNLWEAKIRYMGVGAMVVGGLASIFSVRSGITSGFKRLAGVGRSGLNEKTIRTERDISPLGLAGALVGAVVLVFFLYWSLVGSWPVSLLTTGIMVALAFVFVAVSSYVVGLVGTSNNPVSGMTISALLATAALFLALGYRGDSAILATLGVAAVVCCAATTAGDCSQDLKTGVLVGATPRYQQYGQILGVLIPVFVVAPVLSLLHSSYGIGEQLKAPQSTLFASLVEALFGDEDLPYDMVAYGAAIGIVVLIADAFLKRARSPYRLYLMPLAVGIYLPITLSAPILFGGLVRHFAERSRKIQSEETDSGVLLGSGFIAGEAIMGILIALLVFLNVDAKISLNINIKLVLSTLVLGAVAVYLFFTGRAKAKTS